MIDISVVIPVYNEEENVARLHSVLKEVMDGTGLTYEIIFVDDGSRDSTGEILEKLQRDDPRLVVISLRRNFGQTAAISAGFDHSRGGVIVTLDGDMQNDPKDIPRLWHEIQECDVVSGWRAERKDPFLSRRVPSAIANWLISWVTGVKLHDYGCTLKAYRKEVVDNIRLYGEMHRFIPAIASWMGVRIKELKVAHHPRRFGRSKYGLGRTVRVLLDLLTVKFLLGYSTKPVQVFGPMGLLVGGAGFLISLYLTLLKIITGAEIGGRPLLLLAVLFIILGGQLILMGLLAEMLVRVYFESQGKSTYVVKRVLGRGDER